MFYAIRPAQKFHIGNNLLHGAHVHLTGAQAGGAGLLFNLLAVREVRLSAGAEFVVAVCGDIMTMPGLPNAPSASRIDLADDGTILGLS